MTSIINVVIELKNQLLDPKAANANIQGGHIGLALFSIVIISLQYFVFL